MRSRVFVLMLFFLASLLSFPGLGAAEEAVIDCGTAVAKLESALQSDPEHVLSLFHESMREHPDCRLELLAAAIELTEPEGEALAGLLLVVRRLHPEDYLFAAEVVMALCPDGESVLKEVFAYSAGEVAQKWSALLPEEGESAPQSQQVGAAGLPDFFPRLDVMGGGGEHESVPQEPVAELASYLPAVGETLGAKAESDPQQNLPPLVVEVEPTAGGEESRSDARAEEKVGQVDDEIVRAMEHLSQRLAGEARPGRNAVVAYKRRDRVRVSRAAGEVNEDSLNNALPYDEEDELVPESERGVVVIRDAVMRSSHETWAAREEKSARPEGMVGAEKVAEQPSPAVAGMSYVPEPSSLLLTKIYAIPKPAGPATPRTFSHMMPESERSPAVIRPAAASPTLPGRRG